MKALMLSGIAALVLGACHNGNASAQSSATPPTSVTPQKIISDAAGGGDDFLPDFSYAGYGFGDTPIPNAQGTVLSPATFGAIPNDNKDDSAAIKAALAEAVHTKGLVTLQFEPGRYLITEIIPISRSNLILRGAGRQEGGTELHFPRPLAMVDTGARYDELRQYLEKYDKRQREPDRNLDVLFSEYSWTGGFLWVGKEDARPVPYLEEFDVRDTPLTSLAGGERGALEMTVEDAGALKKGQWITIAWYSDNPDSGIIQSIYGPTDLEIGSHHWRFPNRPLVRHRTKITSVDGARVAIASPLPHAINDQIPAELTLWTPLEQIGIEDLRLTFPDAAVFGHHVEKGYNGIYLTGAADSWVRNLTITNADAGILTDDAAHLTISNIRFDGLRKAHYAMHMGSVGNVLAEYLDVFVPVIHSLSFNTKSVRSVYKNATVWKAPVIDQHAGSNHQNLFDNITLHLLAEQTDEAMAYDVFDGSGAPYWQPGHGRYNTIWNLRLSVDGNMKAGETLSVLGVAEGPDARVVGLHANRPVSLDYRPAPLVSHLGEPVRAVPSLYDYQLMQRAEK